MFFRIAKAFTRLIDTPVVETHSDVEVDVFATYLGDPSGSFSYFAGLSTVFKDAVGNYYEARATEGTERGKWLATVTTERGKSRSGRITDMTLHRLLVPDVRPAPVAI